MTILIIGAFNVEDGVTPIWASSEQLETTLKARHNCELRYDETVVFQRDEPCTNYKNTFYIYRFIFDLDAFVKLRYVMKSIYCHKAEVGNEIIEFADNQHNLKKPGIEESKFIHMVVNEGGIGMFTHSSLWTQQL